jgi:CRISPR-associated protein Cas5d
MGFGIKLKVWGDYACFTRPEMKVERVSYDVITPSAVRGILEAIYWKPALRWEIDRIHVMNPIKFDNIRRNEIKGVVLKSVVASAFNGNDVELYIDSNKYRNQRATLLIRDVCYYIEAHFEMTDKAGSEDTVEKHYNMVLRRMLKGQCYHQPYFGCREFPVNFELVDEIPMSSMGNKDFGLMLWDIDMAHNKTAIFFRSIMNDGIIDVKKCVGESVYS